ncbi:MAG: hypothetical protein RL662_1020 [Bacteroidota bacterium]|jgi:hypothetical protein
MRKIRMCVFLVLGLMSVAIGKAQVGINTTNPQGIFHIDTKGDTDNLGNNSIDDIVINATGNMGIGTLTPQDKVDVKGTLRIADTPTMGTDTEVLIRSSDTGELGRAITIPTRVAFIQSDKDQFLRTQAEKDLFNTAAPFVVTWTSADIASNNVVDFDPINHVFIIREKALYELSGFINYVPGAKPSDTYTSSPDGGRAGVNTCIQIDANDGKGWVDFTGSHAIFGGVLVNNTGQTILIPPAVSIFEAGTKIRMTFKRPSSSFGLPHGITTLAGIPVPVGLKFSKGIEIIAL